MKGKTVSEFYGDMLPDNPEFPLTINLTVGEGEYYAGFYLERPEDYFEFKNMPVSRIKEIIDEVDPDDDEVIDVKSVMKERMN